MIVVAQSAQVDSEYITNGFTNVLVLLLAFNHLIAFSATAATSCIDRKSNESKRVNLEQTSS